ncbi:hypothetical protein LK09_03685 [Microbacterium mangrovi]|uniref:Major facilitator superfamily (MFS) profile domain-containing protein n=1 Tax=Microbacterium mangrovi TaxID=1348253 RepID=A0A0B2A6G5_9MICO|nr:MFS transporter [Microbacterium mangrovi]KHK99129.1 hypothetical protein LK09_03685 [Microbacterium mangrovi]
MAVTFWLLQVGADYAMVGFAVALPICGAIAGSIVGGWLADHAGPVVLLARLNLVLALLAAVALATAVHLPGNPWLLVSVVAVYAVINGASGPAQRSLTPALLEPDDYQHGNAVYSAISNTSSVVGPLLGGIAFSFGGVALTIGVNIAALTLAALVLAILAANEQGEPTADSQKERASFVRSVRGALSYTARNQWLMVLLVIDAIMDLVTSGQFQVGFRVLADRHGGAAVFGLLMAAYGVGAIGGAAIGSRLRAGNRLQYKLIMWSNIVQAPLIALLPFAGAEASLGLLVPVGILNGVSGVLYMTLIFRNTPKAMAGRISALFLAASLSLQPIGIVVFGSVAGAGHIVLLFVCTAALMIGVSIAGLAVWRRYGLHDAPKGGDGRP